MSETVARIDSREFFEGREKLLEIWFRPAAERAGDGARQNENGCDDRKHPYGPHAGLRAIPRERLDDMLNIVQAKILGSCHNEFLDSYVLSESSLFISAHRIVIKTCGTTSLLVAIPTIISLARDCGLTEVQELFFSRHTLLAPQEQPAPHRSFADETACLEQWFDGHSHVVRMESSEGPFKSLNKLDSSMDEMWCVYMLDDSSCLGVSDQTLELHMEELDQERMQLFYKGNLSAAEVTVASGIMGIFPAATVHEYLFEPCGYSCNALMDECYFTIHVTPQKEFSYVSFESDADIKDYAPLVQKVIDLFRPGRFSAVIFSNELSACGRDNVLDETALVGYKNVRLSQRAYTKYELVHASFVRDEDC